MPSVDFIMPPTIHDQVATITAACLLEVLAPKVGNVHPAASFDDLHIGHFIRGSRAIAGPLASASDRGLGPAVKDAVVAMTHQVGTNTHLGIILLLAPLVIADPLDPNSVAQVLRNLNANDAHHIYAAIRMANPGGLGSVDECDIHAEPPEDLVAAMALAADRDLIARQYANAFQDIFHFVVPKLADSAQPLLQRIRDVHVQLLASFGDSLIARKCGHAVADIARAKARAIVDRWEAGGSAHDLVHELDRWLREDGHRRNPGATADLMAAGLYVALRNGLIDS